MAIGMICLRSGTASYKTVLSRRNLFPAADFFSDDSSKKVNLYETLGLHPSATKSEIKKAYFDLTFKYHPDRNENSASAATMFREVTEAYEVLGNYSFKKKYDQGIPLDQVKKTAKKPAVPHHVQHQSFYDSRTVQTSSRTHDQEMKDLNRNPFHKHHQSAMDNDEVRREHERGTVVPQLLAAFIFFSIAWIRYSSGS